jgi:anti-anti-sigma regulatory factor
MTELYASSSAGLRAQAVSAADETLQLGRKTLVMGLDSLAAFDDGAVSAAIVALRRLREAGGSVRLVTGNAAHRKQLEMTGLDRIFDVFSSADEAERRDLAPPRALERFTGFFKHIDVRHSDERCHL